MFVYLYVDNVQMTMRPVQAAHRAGSCILTPTHRELGCSEQRQHRINASTRVLLSPAALLLNGVMTPGLTRAVTCMTANFRVGRTML